MTDLFSKRAFLQQTFSSEKCPLSVYHFSNLFLWKDFFDFSFETIDECLCIFAEDDAGCFMYLPPLGQWTGETLDKCFDYMKKINQKSRLSRIENFTEGQAQAVDHKKYEIYLKSREYCYRREDITGLKGNAYKSKRSSYNQFISGYDYQYLSYEDKYFDRCIGLYRKWKKDREFVGTNDIYNYMLSDNEAVHQLALGNYKELGLLGRVVLVNGDVKAYSFGYELNQDTFCILLEVADLDLKGLSVFIFRSFLEDKSVQRFLSINVMDDCGLENIRQAKESFRPSQIIPVYNVKLKD